MSIFSDLKKEMEKEPITLKEFDDIFHDVQKRKKRVKERIRNNKKRAKVLRYIKSVKKIKEKTNEESTTLSR